MTEAACTTEQERSAAEDEFMGIYTEFLTPDWRTNWAPNRRSCFSIPVYEEDVTPVCRFSSQLEAPASSAYGIFALLAAASIIKPCKSNCCAWTLTKHNTSQMAKTNCTTEFLLLASKPSMCDFKRANICSTEVC